MPESLFGRPRAEIEAVLPDREPVVCPLCGREPRRFGVDFQGLHLARCGACGIEFQHPRPVFEQLAAAVYTDDYHPEGHAAVDRFRERTFARQMDRLERYVSRRPAALLDVGCGAGAFLGYARTRGWAVAGTDIHVTEDARRHGSRFWEGQLPDIDFDDARFDAVRLNHVLEHTQDPLRELRQARRVLSDDGVLLIGVPNVAGLSIRLKSLQSRLGLKRRRWKHYGALHHLWFFTPQTLAALVEAAGFAVTHWETPAEDRPGRSGWTRALVRWPLETARLGGILDLYARPAEPTPDGTGPFGLVSGRPSSRSRSSPDPSGEPSSRQPGFDSRFPFSGGSRAPRPRSGPAVDFPVAAADTSCAG